MDNKVRNEKILQITCELLEKMNCEVENAFVEDLKEVESEKSKVESEENKEKETGQVLVSLTVANPGSLIGFKGRNMVAIQTVLSLIVKNKIGEWIRILLDVNNYRQEQKERLESMVRNLATKVKETGKEVQLVNMSSYERRICHMIAAEIGGVVTESEGEGEERHVVIKPQA